MAIRKTTKSMNDIPKNAFSPNHELTDDAINKLLEITGDNIRKETKRLDKELKKKLNV